MPKAYHSLAPKALDVSIARWEAHAQATPELARLLRALKHDQHRKHRRTVNVGKSLNLRTGPASALTGN
jgi:hypothetical protein